MLCLVLSCLSVCVLACIYSLSSVSCMSDHALPESRRQNWRRLACFSVQPAGFFLPPRGHPSRVPGFCSNITTAVTFRLPACLSVLSVVSASACPAYLVFEGSCLSYRCYMPLPACLPSCLAGLRRSVAVGRCRPPYLGREEADETDEARHACRLVMVGVVGTPASQSKVRAKLRGKKKNKRY